jgi:hypothetical protein
MKLKLKNSWRESPWLVLFFGFMILIICVNRIVVEVHGRNPETYRSPEKVKLRILIADIQLWGGLPFLGMGIWHRNYRKKIQ